MNKAYRIVYLFLLRLPVYLVINGALNVWLYFYYHTNAYIPLSWLTLPLFLTFFLIKELIVEKKTAIIMQCGICLIMVLFLMLALDYVFPKTEFAVSAIMLLLYTFAFGAYEYQGSSINACIFIYTCAVFASIRINIPSLMPLFLPNLSLTVMCRYCCLHFNNTDRFIRSYKCRHQSRKLIGLLRKHNQRIITVFISCSAVLTLGFAFWYYPKINYGSLQEMAETLEPTLDLTNDILKLEWETEVYDTGNNQDMYANELAEALYPENYTTNPAPPNWLRAAFLITLFTAAMALAVWLYRTSRLKTYAYGEQDESYESEAYLPPKRLKARKARPKGTNLAVRRLFLLKVREHIKAGLTIKTSHTPKAIAEKIKETEDIEPLNTAYHKARYGGATVSRKDLDALKNKNPLPLK